MPGKRKNSLEIIMRNRIRRSRLSVFVRSDFEDLEEQYDYDQVGRALRKMVQEGILIKAGYGLYVKATRSRFSGRVVPAVDIQEMIRQVSRKLRIKVQPTELEQLYNSGLSTQIPNGRVIRVTGRVSRKINYNGIPITYEYA